MVGSKLTSVEQQIFDETLGTRNWDLFTEYWFRLPMSGTWYTPEDRVEHYDMLHEIWLSSGKPNSQFDVIVDEQEVEFRIDWDEYYDGNPIFLFPHGFRILPWMVDVISPRTTTAIAVTGAGSGKTCNIAIAGLMYCALFPGFRFLNVAPTREQANLVLGEVEKWAGNTEFIKLVRPTRGVNRLWVERPHATVTIEVIEGYPSTFVCQTVGREAKGILGGERDWINVDEAQLLMGLDTIKPILDTRLRGTRITGHLRWSKQTFITNPGNNPELVNMMDDYNQMIETGVEDVLVLEDIESSDNIYLTKRQLDKQRRALRSSRNVDRWIGGQMAAAFSDNELDETLLEKCRSDEMTKWTDEFGRHNDVVGLHMYEENYNSEKSYVVVGDVGKSRMGSMSSMNVPCIMVFSIPNDFLERPMRMVAFYWFDGQGSYQTFIKLFKHAMYRYKAQGYYDATNVQTAMEDFDDALGEVPTTPIFFSGSVSVKRWAVSVMVMMMSDGLFEWPYIRGLWHQARIFDISSRKRADDIIATILVLMLAFRVEATLMDKIVERYGWDPDEEEKDEIYTGSEDNSYAHDDRYSRFMDNSV